MIATYISMYVHVHIHVDVDEHRNVFVHGYDQVRVAGDVPKLVPIHVPLLVLWMFPFMALSMPMTLG